MPDHPEPRTSREGIIVQEHILQSAHGVLLGIQGQQDGFANLKTIYLIVSLPDQ